MKKYIWNIINSRLLGSGFTIFLYFFIFLQGDWRGSVSFYVTNFILFSICFCVLFIGKSRSINILKITSLFHLIFYVISPLGEVNFNIVYWGRGYIDDNYYTGVNAIIILCFILFLAVYKYAGNIREKESTQQRLDLNINKSELLPLLISGLSTLLILSYYEFNFFPLIIRGGEILDGGLDQNKSIKLIIDNFCRPLCMSLITCSIYLNKSKSSYKLTLLLMGLIACFPTSLPRFAVAGVYIPLLLAIFSRLFFPGFAFINIFIILLFTAFPLLDVFRNVSSDANVSDFQFGIDFFSSGHFDAYQNFVSLLYSGEITYGRQLMGALSFFIPRSYWTDKPMGSGQLVSEKLGLSLDNISQSLLAEGYINFGLLGCLIFAFIWAIVSRLFDDQYWSNKNNNTKRFTDLLYFQFLGLVFFMLRGDMLNAVAYTTGYFSGWALIYISMRASMRRQNNEK